MNEIIADKKLTPIRLHRIGIRRPLLHRRVGTSEHDTTPFELFLDGLIPHYSHGAGLFNHSDKSDFKDTRADANLDP